MNLRSARYAALAVLGATIAVLLALGIGPRRTLEDPRGVVDSKQANQGAVLQANAQAIQPTQHRIETPSSRENVSSESNSATVIGRAITDAGDRLAGAEIIAGRIHAAPQPVSTARVVSTVSSENGSFRLSVPDDWPGECRLWLAARSADGARATLARVPRCSGATGVVLVLVPMASISGRVHNLRDDEVEHAWVDVFSDFLPESPSLRRVPVNKDGTFAVYGLRESAIVQAYCKGRACSKPGGGRLPMASSLHVDLYVGPKSISRRIRVMAEDMKTMPANTPVHVGEEGRLAKVHRTDQLGYLEIDHVTETSTLRIGFSRLSLTSGEWWTRRATTLLTPEQFDAGHVPTVHAPLGCIPRFKLSDDGGGLLSGQTLVLRGQTESLPKFRGTTNEHGVWAASTYTSIAAGEYRLLRPTMGAAPLWKGVLKESRTPIELSVKLKDMRRFRAKLLTSEHLRVSGGGFDVVLSQGSHSDQANVDERGEANLLWRPRLGEPKLALRLRGHVLSSDHWDMEFAFESEAHIQLHGSQFGRVRGQVLHEAGDVPVAGAWISMRDPRLGLSIRMETDAAGKFAHHWVLPGQYKVTAGKAHLRSASDLPEAEVRPHELAVMTIRVASK